MNNDFSYSGSDLRKIALNDFFSVFLKENAVIYYRANYTADAELSKYCSYVEQVSKDTRLIKKKLFFDVKVNSFYDKNYLLDQDRFEYLYSLYNDAETSVYYVIFTPKNTVVFNLTELYAQRKIKFEPSKKIPGKNVCVLRVYQATEIGYIIPSPNRNTTSKTHIHTPSYHTSAPKTTRPIFSADEDIIPIDSHTDPQNQVQPNNKPKTLLFTKEDDFIPITSFDVSPAQLEDDKLYGVKRDGSGQIIFESADHFRRLPTHIQEEFRDRNMIFSNIKDKLERERLLAIHGSIRNVAMHIKEQLKRNVLKK